MGSSRFGHSCSSTTTIRHVELALPLRPPPSFEQIAMNHDRSTGFEGQTYDVDIRNYVEKKRKIQQALAAAREAERQLDQGQEDRLKSKVAEGQKAQYVMQMHVLPRCGSPDSFKAHFYKLSNLNVSLHLPHLSRRRLRCRTLASRLPEVLYLQTPPQATCHPRARTAASTFRIPL